MGRSFVQTLALTVLQMRNYKQSLMVLEHILLAMTYDKNSRRVFTLCDINITELRADLDAYLKENVKIQESVDGDIIQTPAVNRVIDKAIKHARASGRKHAETGDLLLALLSEEDCWGAYYIFKQGVQRSQIAEALYNEPTSETAGAKVVVEDLSQLVNEEDTIVFKQTVSQPSSKNEKEATSESALNRFTVDLLEKAQKGAIDPLIGRETELQRTLEVLLRRRKNNVLFIGEPGTGKTAITEGLALAIHEKRVPPAFQESRIFSLDLGSLLAGAKYRGDFEDRMKSVLKELSEMPNSILVIDEIHTIVGAGTTSGNSMDASNLLKPILATGGLHCIGSTTHEEFRNHFEKDRALSRRFQRVDIREPSQEDCLKILQGLQKYYEDFHNVRYTKEALQSTIELSVRFLQDRLLPDKAIDILDEAAASTRLENKAGQRKKSSKSNKKRTTVDTSDIEKIVARMANIPLTGIAEDQKANLKSFESDLEHIIFGQNHAIKTTTQAILRAKAGLTRENRPQASFLFYGPTGVGKTELAKSIAKLLHVPFLRFDMSEYMEKHAVSRLIGSPPGYVGYEQGGLLTEAVARNPHSVILLDEIEKAHPDMYNILLQVMDYATLTDNNGKKIDFRHVTLIMTSNAGAREMEQSPMGFTLNNKQNTTAQGTKALENTFSPEFRNRLDAMISFNPLQHEHMKPIVQKTLKELGDSLNKKNIQLQVSEEALDWLASKGYDSKLGARPLQRLIRTEVEDILARELLFGELVNGGKVFINTDNSKEKLRFEYS